MNARPCLHCTVPARVRRRPRRRRRVRRARRARPRRRPAGAQPAPRPRGARRRPRRPAWRTRARSWTRGGARRPRPWLPRRRRPNCGGARTRVLLRRLPGCRWEQAGFVGCWRAGGLSSGSRGTSCLPEAAGQRVQAKIVLCIQGVPTALQECGSHRRHGSKALTELPSPTRSAASSCAAAALREPPAQAGHRGRARMLRARCCTAGTATAGGPSRAGSPPRAGRPWRCCARWRRRAPRTARRPSRRPRAPAPSRRWRCASPTHACLRLRARLLQPCSARARDVGP